MARAERSFCVGRPAACVVGPMLGRQNAPTVVDGRLSVIGDRWGVSESETLLAYPCDAFVAVPTLQAWRGVHVKAPAEVVWPWVAQVRLAPYSYDWIDNLGRRSPRELRVDTLGPADLHADWNVLTVAVPCADPHVLASQPLLCAPSLSTQESAIGPHGAQIQRHFP